MNTATQTQLHENCLSIAKQIERDCEGEDFEVLSDAMDIEFTCGPRKNFIGARLLVAFGGPNIWVNTRNCTVEGSWGGDRVEVRFDDDDRLQEICEEHFNCLYGC